MTVLPELDVKVLNLTAFRLKAKGEVSKGYDGRQHLVISIVEDAGPEALHVYPGEPATKGAGLTVD